MYACPTHNRTTYRPGSYDTDFVGPFASTFAFATIHPSFSQRYSSCIVLEANTVLVSLSHLHSFFHHQSQQRLLPPWLSNSQPSRFHTARWVVGLPGLLPAEADWPARWSPGLSGPPVRERGRCFRLGQKRMEWLRKWFQVRGSLGGVFWAFIIDGARDCVFREIWNKVGFVR